MHWVRRHILVLSTGVLLALLAAKFFYPIFAFDLPLGYDTGMYRNLFIRYAEVFPPFSLPALRPWAQEYPYGLFIVTSYFIKIGVPVDWFLGWIWSVFAVALIALIAWVFARKEGTVVGVLTLLMGLLSLAYYDGFASMYWKTFFSLFFLVLTLQLFERRSLWMIPSGAFCLLSHNQTGLILGLVLLAWWILHLPRNWRDPAFRRLTIVFAAIACLGIVWYAPIWFRAFWAPLKSVLLLRGDSAPGGGFAEPMYYVRHGTVLFFLGIGGFIASFRRERFSVWQLAVVVCAIFIVFRLVFYRRFYLQYDFFVLPYAAWMLQYLWIRFRNLGVHGALIGAILLQGYFALPGMLRWGPFADLDLLQNIEVLPQYIEDDAAIIALENQAAVWLLGWLPDYYIGGPGLFDFPNWKYAHWEKFLYGTHDDRVRLLSGIKKRPLYLMTSPFFFAHYGDFIKPFMADPCFEQVEGAPLLKVVCPPAS